VNARKLSVFSAIAASSCCVPPLILLGMTLLGIGTVGLAGFSSTLGSIKWYVMPLAIVGVSLSYYMYFREKKKCAGTACKMANATFTKTMLTISTMVVFGFLTWSVYPYVIGSGAPLSGGDSSVHFAVYQVDGMTCGGCEISVDAAVAATGIVDSAKSSFMEQKTYVWFGESGTDFDKIEDAIKSVGYEPLLLESN